MRKEANMTYFDLMKGDQILFSGRSYNEAFYLVNNPSGPSFTEEEISKNIKLAELRISQRKVNELEAKYERPDKGVDNFLIALIILLFVGFVFSAIQFRLNGTTLFVSFLIVIIQTVLLTAILTSRKNDRALMDRLDEVEKKLDMFKKPIDKQGDK
jgi:hypothetical protein